MDESERPEDSLYYKVSSHPFMLDVIQNDHPVQELIVREIISKISKTQTTKEDIERALGEVFAANGKLEFKYHNEVFYYATNLAHGIERLDMTPIFLQRFSRSKTYNKHGINLHKWIQYHYSNYLITVTSIYDTVLLLTNAVFILNINPRYCTTKPVVKKMNSASVEDALEQLKNIVDKYRDPRNFFAHRNILPDLPMLDKWERHRFIHETTQLLEIESKPIYPPFIVKKQYQRERRELIHFLQKENIHIVDAVDNFLTKLKPIYSIYTRLLSSKSRSGKTF